MLKEILTISELTKYITDLLQADPFLQQVSVRGELSNFYNHSSGHCYFTLKDQSTQIKCVMFRNAAQTLKFRPENGMSLIATGAIGIYPNRGEYQLYVEHLEPDGIGALHLAFEQLKTRLAQEGLFAAELKKPIPYLPRRIGVITSPTGAAIRDIISVITRRFPNVEMLLAPAIVQGGEAPLSLVRALELLQTEKLDVIIIGRGGGSLEDLWAFNDEIVARAIFASEIPVISAVGHETDFTIADFVADLRAPTPSAAAELAVANYQELSKYLQGLEQRLHQCLVNRLTTCQERLAKIQRRQIFLKPDQLLLKSWQRVDELEHRLQQTMIHQLTLAKERARTYFRQLESLNPLNVLARGYSLTEKISGATVKSLKDVEIGEQIRVNLQDGRVFAKIENLEKN